MHRARTLPKSPLIACLHATLAVAALGACRSPTSPTGTGNSSPLMPLAVGTQWVYQFYESVDSGTVFTPGPAGTAMVAVAKDTVIAGEHFALLTGGLELLEEGGSSPVFVANRRDGLYEYTPPSPGVVLPLDAPLLRFPYPTKRGAHFGVDRWVVASTDTVITVPAGTFHCLRYDLPSGWVTPGQATPDTALTESYFVAPGVGVVLRVYPQTRGYDGSGHLLGTARLLMRLEQGPVAGTVP